MSLLCLGHHGHDVGRYVSLERLTEETREDYYEALHASSQGWHEGRHDLVPWLGDFLGVLRRAWQELEARAGAAPSQRGAKAERVLRAVQAQSGGFTLSDIQRACPGVGRDWIRRQLADLREQGKAICTGRGRGARWRYEGE